MSTLLSLDEFVARRAANETSERWGLAALRGRLVELSARGATATLTSAMSIVVEAQHAAEPVAWIALDGGTFFPPDAADGGVDLAALVVVRVRDAAGAVHAAARVLKSGAFGLVVIDLGAASDEALSMAHQGRLVTLAQAHDAAVLCLTEKTAEGASIGSLVSLRVEALRITTKQVELRALKDKRRGPDWTKRFAIKGPAGYR